MPLFDYLATDSNGKMKKGRLSANNRQAALAEIIKKGYVIESIKAHNDSIWYKDMVLGAGVKLKEKVVFLRQFATIIQAGVPVAEALEILSDQEEKNKYFKNVIRQMAADLSEGQTLSKAFEKHPKIFGSIIVHMIRAGETSGRLEESLEHLAEYYEKQNKSRQKLTTAMIYPFFVLLMSVAVVIFMLTWIVPMFQSMFQSIHGKLPLITRFTISMSNGLKHTWLLLLLVLIALIILSIFIFKNPSSKKWLDGVILKVPLVGVVTYKTELARLLWMLALLIASSVPVIDALESIKKITSNLMIREAIGRVASALDFGKPLSEAFRGETIFPPIIYHMTAIGEKTGMLDKMLNHVATYYDNDVEQLLERMKALIEPVVILFLATVVGFIVMSIIIPMFQMYQQF